MCKERKYPIRFPLEELASYATVAVVRIDVLESLGPAGRYAPPFRATGTVIKPLKGKLREGAVIEAVTQQNVEAYARCPVSLETGSTYLLFLHGNKSPFVVPRYGSLYLAADHRCFSRYVTAIGKACR